MAPKLVILATGESGAGKDYCAAKWVTKFQKTHTARVVSISDEFKREYALATAGVDITRLLTERKYKETHRSAMKAFLQKQIEERPNLFQENFEKVVKDAANVDVLIITGMRDEAPVAAFSHLIHESRMLDVRVLGSKETRRTHSIGTHNDDERNDGGLNNAADVDYRPSLTFTNDTKGSSAAIKFAEEKLLPYLHADFDKLADMVRSVQGYPREEIEFRHVLCIAQQPGGLALCTSLLETQFNGDWSQVSAIVSPEVGGLVFAPTLAISVDKPLVLIREGGKLPPPTVSVVKPRSYISASTSSSGVTKEGGVATPAQLSNSGTPATQTSETTTSEVPASTIQMYPYPTGPGMPGDPYPKCSGMDMGAVLDQEEYGAYPSPYAPRAGAGGGNSGGPRFGPPIVFGREESTAMESTTKEKRIEMDRDAITAGSSVVVVDDVLSTGKTLCAVLELLGKAGVEAEDVIVLVVAEFPKHRGRELLRKRGYGRARVQSLLVLKGD